jgi:hypothetical protein
MSFRTAPKSPDELILKCRAEVSLLRLFFKAKGSVVQENDRSWKDTWACGKGTITDRFVRDVYAHISVTEPRPDECSDGKITS